MKGMQKIKRGTGFRGVLEYALENGKGDVIGGNMAGETPRELSTEFGYSRRMREEVEKPVWHNSLRLPQGEKLPPEQWATIADDYMKKMGFGELHQRAYILHDDKAGQHIHIIASRVDLTGKLYLGQNENLKSTQIIAQLEKQHGLTQTAQGRDPNSLSRKTITTGEKGLEIRTGEVPTRKQLQAIIDKATADKPRFNEFVSRLHAAKVSVLPSGKTGVPQGVSFEIHGQAFKGSDMGKSYAWKQLQTRTDYEPSRDQGIIDRLRQEPSAAQWNTAALDKGASAAEKLKNKLDERAQAKVEAAKELAQLKQAQAAKTESDRIAQEAATIKQAQAEAAKPAPEQPKKPKSKDHDWER